MRGAEGEGMNFEALAERRAALAKQEPSGAPAVRSAERTLPERSTVMLTMTSARPRHW